MCDIGWMSPQTHFILCQTPFLWTCAAVAMSCLKPTQQWPQVSGQVDTGQLDCGILYQIGVHRRSRLPVFTAPTWHIHCCRISPEWLSRLKSQWGGVYCHHVVDGLGEVLPGWKLCLSLPHVVELSKWTHIMPTQNYFASLSSRTSL